MRELLNRARKAAALLSVLAVTAFALSQGLLAATQTGTQVWMDPSRADAAGLVAASTNYNTVNTQAVATTQTPSSGQCVYITRIELEAIQDGTATAAVNVNFTSTGINSTPSWGFSLAATADATLYRDVNFQTPLKGNAGTAVVITSPTAALHLAYGSKIYYYVATC